MLRTRPPLGRIPLRACSPFDLHVLSTPPAFVLSQDQTRHTERICLGPPGDLRRAVASEACSSVVESSCTTQSAPGMYALRPALSTLRSSRHQPSVSHVLRAFPLLALYCFSLFSCQRSVSSRGESPRVAAPSRGHPLNISPSLKGVKGISPDVMPRHAAILTSLSPCSLPPPTARLVAEGEVGEGFDVRGDRERGSDLLTDGSVVVTRPRGDPPSIAHPRRVVKPCVRIARD